jgi:hypothetical protein
MQSQKSGTYDIDAVKTLQLLSETHMRKAKLLLMRQNGGSLSTVKNKVNQMIKEQEKLKKGKDLTE